MQIRSIFKSIDCDLEQFNELDDALLALIVTRVRPVFDDPVMELTFTNLLCEFRQEVCNSWNRYVSKCNCKGE